jgi:two-component system response regulator LytT
MNVLIVEDESLIAQRIERFTRRILGPAFTHLRASSTFDEASAWLAEQPVDVVLLDLNLAGRDGMELLQASVAGAFHTIIISANADQALGAFEYGVLDFVPKPFNEERLARTLARVRGERTTPATKYLAMRKHGRIEPIAVVRAGRGQLLRAGAGGRPARVARQDVGETRRGAAAGI